MSRDFRHHRHVLSPLGIPWREVDIVVPWSLRSRMRAVQCSTSVLCLTWLTTLAFACTPTPPPPPPPPAPKPVPAAPRPVVVPVEPPPPAAPIVEEPAPLAQPARGVLFRPGELLPEGHFICPIAGDDEVLACRDGDVCCDDRVCMSRDEATTENCFSRIECETNADCPAAQECCYDSLHVNWQMNGGGSPDRHQWCGTDCRQGPLCRRGTCPKGSSCAFSLGDLAVDPNALGVCHKDDAEIACGASTCTGSTPFCHWDPTTRSGTCVATNSYQHVFECVDGGDCQDDEICALRAGGAWSNCCRPASCFDESEPTIACATNRDCRSMRGRCALSTPTGYSPPIAGLCVAP